VVHNVRPDDMRRAPANARLPLATGAFSRPTPGLEVEGELPLVG